MDKENHAKRVKKMKKGVILILENNVEICMALDKQVNKLFQDAVDILREQRHDILNHFQVVLGYLQMNNHERAVSYMRHVTSEMGISSNIIGLENYPLSILLLKVAQNSKRLEVKFSFNSEPKVLSYKNYNEKLLAFLDVSLNLVIDRVSQMDQGERWVKITLKESTGELKWEISFPPQVLSDTMIQEIKNGQLDTEIKKSEKAATLISLFQKE